MVLVIGAGTLICAAYAWQFHKAWTKEPTDKEKLEERETQEILRIYERLDREQPDWLEKNRAMYAHLDEREPIVIEQQEPFKPVQMDKEQAEEFHRRIMANEPTEDIYKAPAPIHIQSDEDLLANWNKFMPDGVMVAQKFLVLLVLVRVQVR